MRLPLRQLILAGSGLAIWAACAGGAATTDDETPTTAVDEQATDKLDESPRFGTFGFDTAGMNRDVHPGDDFYLFASGSWEETTEIPSDRSRYGVFDMLSLEAEEDVLAIIDEAAKYRGEPGDNNQLIGDLYRSWMDADAIDHAGLAPVLPYLETIAELDDHDDAAALMASLGYPSIYGVHMMPDPQNPDVYALRAFQSGLGMPNRDYYLDESDRFEQYRQAYRDYIITIHALAGLDDGETKADAIIALETKLAEAHWTRERSRQITETYNVMTVQEFDDLAPDLNLAEALHIMGIDELEELVVAQPDAIEAAGQIFAGTDLETLRDYLTFHFLSDRASWLPTEFDEASFEFFSRTLRGTEEQRDRDRRGTQLVGRHLGHAVGQEYVARHFPPQSRAQMEELVHHLIVAFEGRLKNLDWMDDETRAEALQKLSTFESRIGYPEIWQSFEGLHIEDGDYFGNRMRLDEFWWHDGLERFYEPVDRRRWSWPPQIVNASYHPMLNQITFPAGILQAPFFDPHADPALNYGAIDAVIGHEIGHGFDDQGRRYDAQGRLRDWWTEDTDAQFEVAASALANQYSQFCPIDDLCVNGRLALGENIGDLGGMQMAYAAYRNYVEQTYPDGQAPVLDGFTGDQRFFLAWAQVWRSLYRDDALRAQLVNGPHSPGIYRVNGVVRNMDAWYEAFDVTEDHDLYLPPEERVSIW